MTVAGREQQRPPGLLRPSFGCSVPTARAGRCCRAAGPRLGHGAAGLRPADGDAAVLFFIVVAARVAAAAPLAFSVPAGVLAVALPELANLAGGSRTAAATAIGTAFAWIAGVAMRGQARLTTELITTATGGSCLRAMNGKASPLVDQTPPATRTCRTQMRGLGRRAARLGDADAAGVAAGVAGGEQCSGTSEQVQQGDGGRERGQPRM